MAHHKCAAMFVFALALCSVVSVSALESTEKRFNMVAYCTGVEEVPRTTSAYRAVALMNQALRILTYKIYHNYPDQGSNGAITAAHIHGPAYAGITGDVVHTLDHTTNPIVGSWEMSSGQESDMLDGKYYINIHTTANPAGDIRGQMIFYNVQVDSLSTGEETPSPNTALTNAGVTPANVVGYLQTRLDGLKLWYHIEHNVAAVTALNLHAPANPGATVGSQYTLTALEATIELSEITQDWFNSGQFYINIANATVTTGVIRAQIDNQPHYVAELLGEYETTPVTSTNAGAAYVQHFPSNGNRFVVSWTTNAPITSAHVHGPGAPGVDGAVICTLTTTAKTGTKVCPALTDEQVTWLQSGQLYVNMHTAANPGGELRGQIMGLKSPPEGGYGAGATTAAQIAAPVAVISLGIAASVFLCAQCKRNGAYCFKGGKKPAKQYSSPSASETKPSAKPARPAAKPVKAAVVQSTAPASAVPRQLPAGWSIHENEQGYTYYFHEETGTSSWDPPAGSVF